jgi:hypothetical protein
MIFGEPTKMKPRVQDVFYEVVVRPTGQHIANRLAPELNLDPGLRLVYGEPLQRAMQTSKEFEAALERLCKELEDAPAT